MSSSDSPQSIPFRCKKTITAKPKPGVSNQKPNPTELASKTPEKQPSRRARNSRMALSLKEIRKAAQTKPQQPPTDQIESARKQISSSPSVESPVNHARRGSPKLPEKYMQLAEFFDSLDGVIRLLKLKCSSPTFTNICPKIECLTDRRFSHGHLAQLKFILPEVIQMKKVLTYDEKTSCMKPDLHVTVNADAIECDGNLKCNSKNLNLRKVFRARLMDFLKDHPEGDEIPEETLPEPFNQSRSNLQLNMARNSTSLTPADSSTEASVEQQQVSSPNCQNSRLLNIIKAPSISMVTRTSASASDNQQPIVASHFSSQRHFSRKFVNSGAEKNKADRMLSDVSTEPSATPALEPCLRKISSSEETCSIAAISPVKLSSKSTSKENCLMNCASPTHFPQSCPPATPVKEIDPLDGKGSYPIKVDSKQSTPAKLASTPARLMIGTPALHQPKRCYMTPENDSASSPNKLTRRPPHSRTLKSLKFDTPVKNATVEHEFNEGISVDGDILDILPENLIQSIREKERKVMEEQDPAISHAKWRRQLIASLPKLFNTIHFLFQSIKRSVITKEELIHKIISSHLQITDRREVEEQMNLMLELVPEWISEKLSSCGDLLVRINKMTCPESIRARLEEAK